MVLSVGQPRTARRNCMPWLQWLATWLVVVWVLQGAGLADARQQGSERGGCARA